MIRIQAIVCTTRRSTVTDLSAVSLVYPWTGSTPVMTVACVVSELPLVVMSFPFVAAVYPLLRSGERRSPRISERIPVYEV
jgi:hypothetical protein